MQTIEVNEKFYDELSMQEISESLVSIVDRNVVLPDVSNIDKQKLREMMNNEPSNNTLNANMKITFDMDLVKEAAMREIRRQFDEGIAKIEIRSH